MFHCEIGTKGAQECIFPYAQPDLQDLVASDTPLSRHYLENIALVFVSLDVEMPPGSVLRERSYSKLLQFPTGN